MILKCISRRRALALLGTLCATRFSPAFAVGRVNIDSQPYFANVKRALDTLEKLGTPIGPEDMQRIAALGREGDAAAVEAAEAVLDGYTLANLSVDVIGSLKVDAGGAPRVLVEHGWRVFLIRIRNASGKDHLVSFSGPLETPAGLARDLGMMAQRADLMDTLNKAPLVERLWLLTEMHDAEATPVGSRAAPTFALSGLPVEYHVIQLFSRDRGSRTAKLTFSGLTGFSASTQVESRNPAEDEAVRYRDASRKFDFDCLPTRLIELTVRDADGRGCMAALTIRDKHGHVYPPQAMRLEPDMRFQRHIYRADGESVRLPDGQYTVESVRGPEYLRTAQTIEILGGRARIDVRLRRWIDPSRWGWYSGDPHIHAAGCLHYQVPTEGVSPATVIRHVRGEGLSIAEVLTWGPGWYYQKQFFTGETQSPQAILEHPQLQAANNAIWQPHPTSKDDESLLRYDVEVSGFPSSLCGHLVLLRLKEQDYPGTKVIEDWPSWNLPILQWAKAQGAVVGYAHCAQGMIVDSTDLPNYEIPPFDSIGTNEAIVDVTHGVTDFLSGCNLSAVAELNAWYHLLNCGFRLALVGETDYPCIWGEGPGVGRTYVRLNRRPKNDAGYQEWIDGIRKGQLYCGDGRSHILDFRVDDRRSGEDLPLNDGGMIEVRTLVAARLEPEPKPVNPWGWHLEKARIGRTREVSVELIVNGIVVDCITIVADGVPREVTFKTELSRSSWVAVRILHSVHAHPVFVQIGGRPIRASKRSAQWCRTCVDALWDEKSPLIRDSERAAAARAFDHARKVYDAVLGECEIE